MKIGGELNINTLITAGTLLVSVAMAYATLDKRVSILEQLAAERSSQVEKQLEELKVQIKELTVEVKNMRKDRN